MRRLLAATAAFFMLSLSGCYMPGLVTTGDHQKSANAGQQLGAKVMRVEFDISASASSLDADVGYYAARGIRILPLAGFDSRMPSQQEAENLGSWAARFGKDGTFWQGRADGDLAITDIEFGNETSYCYQFPVNCGGAWYAEPSYLSRAETYAHRIVQAKTSIHNAVGLIAQADDGGSGSSNWTDHMFQAEPNLQASISGFSVHPYGPRSRWEPKLDRTIAQTGAHNAGDVPIDITEWGISSDNGRNLSDNYGFPTNLTYSQAASNLATEVQGIRDKLGNRLRYFLIYAAHDAQPSGATNNRETYFGAVQFNLTDKGEYTAEVRRQLAK